MTKEAIASAITRLGNGDSPNGASSKEPKADSGNSFLSRCRAIGNGASGVMFNPSEVRDILRLVLEQVHSRAEEQEIDGDTEDGDESGSDEEDQAQEFTIEERPWSAEEIAGQLQILSDAAGLDWHEELTFAVKSLEEAEEERAKQLDQARQHVIRNLILDEGNVTRLSTYERQVNSQFKSTYALLERARAWRLGMPVPPPVSVDLIVSKGHDANGV